MELLYEHSVTVAEKDVNDRNQLKLSALLYYAQETAGAHCSLLGFDRDALEDKNLFWAVLRHRVILYRLPAASEEITVQTWPMPVTRAAYPRAVRALDRSGQKLFEVMSLWVLMDRDSRGMMLPGKSGVDVPGIVLGDEPSSPGSLIPGTHDRAVQWTVTPDDLDINGHVNNTKYLDHVEQLTADLCQTQCPKEITVCYLAEGRLGQTFTLHYTMSPEGVFTLDGTRPKTDAPEKTERVFAVKAVF